MASLVTNNNNQMEVEVEEEELVKVGENGELLEMEEVEEHKNIETYISKWEKVHQLAGLVRLVRLMISNRMVDFPEECLGLHILLETGGRPGSKITKDGTGKGILLLEKNEVKIVGNSVILDYIGKGAAEIHSEINMGDYMDEFKSMISNSRNNYIFSIESNHINSFLKSLGLTVTCRHIRNWFASYHYEKFMVATLSGDNL